MVVEARLRSLSVGAHVTARDEERKNTGLSDRARNRGVPPRPLPPARGPCSRTGAQAVDDRWTQHL